MTRLFQALRFQMERLLLRGLGYRLLLMAGAVVVVSVLGGVLLQLIGAEETPGQSVWWAFLRLTDPGYLGDDQGAARRVVSTAITIAGYVLFMGALIAILTQALQETIRSLQRGETPIILQGHIVLLGLTERTPIVLAEMLRIEPRVERFLARMGRRRSLKIVVLVEELDEGLRAKLKDELGDTWDDRDIILRSGSPLVAEHLERVDFANAAAILIPGGREDSDDDMRDATVVKTLLSITRHPAIAEAERPPRVVAELLDARLVDVVRPEYRGSMALVPSDTMVSRLLVQNLRHQGLSWVLSELLAYDQGADLYFHDLPQLDGLRFAEAAERIAHGVALGFVRPGPTGYEAHLNPHPDSVFGAADRMVIATHTYEDITPLADPRAPVHTGECTVLPASMASERRVLVMGWSPRLVSMLNELETYRDETFHVDVVSMLPNDECAKRLARAGVEPDRVTIRHLDGDYTNVRDVRRLDLLKYDNLVLLGRSHLHDEEQSDAQTVIGYMIVRDLLRGQTVRPSVLVELLDPDNAALFSDVPGEVILSPTVMGRLLAHISLRPELTAVLDELFTVGGAEILYRSPKDYGLETGEAAFCDLALVARSHSELLLGVRVSTRGMDVSSDLTLAPEPNDRFEMGPNTQLAVITTMSQAGASVG